MAEQEPVAVEPSEQVRQLADLVEEGNGEQVATFLNLLPPEDTVYTLANLDPDLRAKMFSELAASHAPLAADLMEHFADGLAADIIDDLHPTAAAAIVDEMDSDEQADVLAEFDDDYQQAVLEQMDPEEAQDARERLQYDWNTAGGLMITEYLVFPDDQDVDDVIRDLRRNAELYNEYEVRYIYVVDRLDRFRGIVNMRSLLLAPPNRRLSYLMRKEPITVTVDETLDVLEDIFDRYDVMAVPVLDAGGKLVGVVQRAAVQEAIGEREAETYMKLGGIIGGEEIRTMPLWGRTFRRLMFLLPNIALSYAAVSIIAMYEPIIERLTALAIFIPMVANLSGAAGNQAVAVSIRELSLGVTNPDDVMRVWRKEVLLGLVNGIVIGAALLTLCLMTRPEQPIVAMTVGGAYVLNSILAVLLGGGLPLLLSRLKVDPAMMSSPILTTLTDMGSFFLVLTAAAVALRFAAPSAM